MSKIRAFLSKLKNSKIFSFVLMVLLMLGLIVSIYLVGQRQEIRNKAAETEIPTGISPNNDYTKLVPLTINQPIFSYKISGSVIFEKPNSYVRVILLDKEQKEYLVYESYPLISGSNAFKVIDVCEETCILDAIIPSSLRIEGYKSSFQLSNPNFVKTLKEANPQIAGNNIISESINLKNETDSLTIQKLNEQLDINKMSWIAGETEMSKKTYAEKKKMFTNPDGSPVDHLPNLQGFEYYKGGIFQVKTDNSLTIDKQNPAISASDNLPQAWDWRNVNGENWMTPVKDQGPYGTCWAFAQIGRKEAFINISLNRHLDLDLSEQFYISGCTALENNNPGYAKTVDENCFPYQNPSVNCAHMCTDWQSRLWGNRSSLVSFNTLADLKAAIINRGPLYLDYTDWNHAMVIVGYGYDDSQADYIIVKNSWGTWWGEGGYGKLSIDSNFLNKNAFSFAYPPIIKPSISPEDVFCEDKDNDQYCYWGVGNDKPNICPSFCKQEKDCNDNDPTKGPIGPNCLFNKLSELNCDISNNRDVVWRWSPPLPPDPEGSYRLQVSNNRDFSGPLLFDKCINDYQLAFPEIGYNITLYGRVKGCSIDNWSEVKSCKTLEVCQMPNVCYPESKKSECSIVPGPQLDCNVGYLCCQVMPRCQSQGTTVVSSSSEVSPSSSINLSATNCTAPNACYWTAYKLGTDILTNSYQGAVTSINGPVMSIGQVFSTALQYRNNIQPKVQNEVFIANNSGKVDKIDVFLAWDSPEAEYERVWLKLAKFDGQNITDFADLNNRANQQIYLKSVMLDPNKAQTCGNAKCAWFTFDLGGDGAVFEPEVEKGQKYIIQVRRDNTKSGKVYFPYSAYPNYNNRYKVFLRPPIDQNYGQFSKNMGAQTSWIVPAFAKQGDQWVVTARPYDSNAGGCIGKGNDIKIDITSP